LPGKEGGGEFKVKEGDQRVYCADKDSDDT